MTTSGTYAVYKITNNSNGKFYIGVTSRCIFVRLKKAAYGLTFKFAEAA